MTNNQIKQKLLDEGYIPCAMAGPEGELCEIAEKLRQDMAERIVTEIVEPLEKAYGGCHKCYGKGYATYRSAYSGHGTDGDIDGYEGRFYKPHEEIRFCTCKRGKQLEALTDNNKEKP